jgi:low affinity Fe/Cu permease
MSVEPQVPPPGEEIHLPGGSLQPLLVSIGVTVALLGLTTTWILTVAGIVLTTWVVIQWIADCRRDIAELPAHLDHH